MEITLLTKDELGYTRSVEIHSSRFTIGRGQDNDLVIDDRHLSRRHSLIEAFDATVQVSDCGSENGTFVNGTRIAGAYVLCDGDEISFGESNWFTIRIGRAQTLRFEIPDSDQTRGRGDKEPNEPGSGSPVAPATLPSRRSDLIALFIAAGAGLLLVSGVLVVILLLGENRHKPISESSGREAATNEKADPHPDEGTGDGASSPANAEIEDDVIQVMRSISSDPSPSLPPPGALEDIKTQLAQYRSSSTLPPLLRSMRIRVREIKDSANRAGLSPNLVIWMSLASLDGGRAGQDPEITYRRIVTDLPRLYALFGTDNADRALLLVAAYKMGRGTGMSHPLLERLPGDPYKDVNVWYQNELRRLPPEAYDFVIRFLALGVIASDPGKFHIEGERLAF